MCSGWQRSRREKWGGEKKSEKGRREKKEREEGRMEGKEERKEGGRERNGETDHDYLIQMCQGLPGKGVECLGNLLQRKVI